MHDTMLSVSYESLGEILEQLRDAPEVKTSPALAERVRNAIAFHQQISAEVLALKQERQLLDEKLSALTREPGERVCPQTSPYSFGKYEKMRDQGATPQEVFLLTQTDGLDRVGALTVLRRLFQLSLEEAQGLISQTESQTRQRAA